MKTKKMNPTKYIRRSLTLALFGLVACAKVDFAQNSNPSCTGSTCTSIAGVNNYNYNVTGSGQPIDILFVVDNSASMSSIQQGIAAAFGNSLFTIINQYDYHLAITTTDISGVNNPARAVNNNGAWQDGKLLQFGGVNGPSFLTNSTANASSLFSSTIYRPESIACDAWVRANCPVTGCTNKAAYDQVCASGDTRAIYAANLTVSSDATGFLRANAPLAIVIISNADERFGGRQNTDPLLSITAVDEPSYLVSTVQSKGKKMAAYPIIIKPGDTACLAAQTQPVFASLFGHMGNIYNELAVMTGGSVGSVCPVTSNAYSTALQSIGSGIVNNQMNSITLNCAPTSGTVTVTDSNNVSQVLSVSAANSKILVLPTPLAPNQTINLRYSCSTM